MTSPKGSIPGRRRQPIGTKDPIVRRIFLVLDNRSSLSLREIAQEAGISIMQLTRIRTGRHSGRLSDIVALAWVAGLELTLIERENDAPKQKH